MKTKLLSRDFTLKEKILILVLVLILLGLGYYYFVDQPLRTALATAQAEEESLTTELTAVEAKLATMRRMRDELDSVIGSAAEMGSYNNSKAEIALLNDYLADTNQYSVSFATVTRDGDQIRRSFSLQFSVSDYKTVQDVIVRLAECPYRCLVSDMQCSITRHWRDNRIIYSYFDPIVEGDLIYDYSVNLTATFYETMVGGVPDAGLPENKAAE